MARYTGNDGVVLEGATAVANVRSFEHNETGDEIDMPAMGDSAKVRLPGKPDVGGTIQCWWDPADAGQLALVQGATVALKLQLQGTGVGKPQLLMSTARITGVKFRGPVNAGAEAEFTYVSDTLAVKTVQ